MIVLRDSNESILENYNYVALGSFDGLHLGHMTLVEETKIMADKNNGNSMVFTFENHPLTLVKPDKAPCVLMTIDEKISFLKEKDINILVLKKFDFEMMNSEPEDFIKMLVNDYNVKGIVVGFNFRFGKGNLGDINMLKEYSHIYKYQLVIKEPCNYEKEPISSTRIRGLLENGHISKANDMLGYKYNISGKVIDGKKLGRTIGFPTANLEVELNKKIPQKGVYYTKVVYDSKEYKGITNIGYNPTVNGNNLSVETYILDFNKDIYGEYINIQFISRIRDERKFSSLDQLVIQLKKDKEYAKFYQN